MIICFILALIVPLSSSYRCNYTGIQKPNNFQWKASVNTISGIAYSTETSLVYVPSYQPTSCSSSITEIPSTRLKKFQLKAKKIFESYPYYISSGQVSLGLLRSSNSIKSSNNKDDNCYFPTGQWSNVISLRDRFLSINLLQFGECQSTLINTFKRTEVLCEIPIVGGLLAYKGRSEDKESSTPREFGALQFKLIEKPPCGSDKDESVMIFETRILSYKPALCSSVSGPPIHPVRKMLYLYTQRYVHAFVMWRFHGWCRHQLETLE